MYSFCICTDSKPMVRDNKEIRLTSKEGIIVGFPFYLKEVSKIVHFSYGDDDDPIFLPYSSKTLNNLRLLVLRLPSTARNYQAKNAPMRNIYQVTENTNLEELTFLVNGLVYDNVFHLLYTILTLPREEIVDLLRLSNFLKIPSLVNAISRFVASVIQKDLDKLPRLDRQRKLKLDELLRLAVNIVTKYELPYELVERISKHVYLQTLSVSEKTIADQIGLSGVPEVSRGSINLSNKEITGISGLELLKYPEVRWFDLSSNSILGNDLDLEFPPIPFKGLMNLQWISLSRNEITSLPWSIFSKLEKLQSLALNSNELTTLPVNLFSGLEKLERIYLTKNKLTTLEAGLFNNLVNLQELYLHENRLKSLPISVFHGLAKLQRLYLQENQLITLQAGVFSQLTELQRLDLSNNQLNDLPVGVFNGLKNLVELYLTKNKLAVLPGGVFNGLTNLDTLDLGENLLTILPPGLFNQLVSLRWLVLTKNYFPYGYKRKYPFPPDVLVFI